MKVEVKRDPRHTNPPMGVGSWGFVYESYPATGHEIADSALYTVMVETHVGYGYNSPQEAQEGCARHMELALQDMSLHFENVTIVQRLRVCTVTVDAEGPQNG